MAGSIKDILKNPYSIIVSGSLWIEANGEHFCGPGPIELLERIEATGSISMAAKEMKMSYKKAWELVNNLNAHTARPMVIPHAGGEKGGGSTITPEAVELINFHRQMRERFAAFLASETDRLKK
ncbi:MAG: LysR family transcriptional regulator [Bacteroidota bacterium]|nr:LysR family transcriptional regulator [Bacteroidota bacterium]